MDEKPHKHVTIKHIKMDKPHDDEQRSRMNKKSSRSSKSLNNLLSPQAILEVHFIMNKTHKVQKEKLVKAKLSVLRAEKKNYTQASKYRAYQFQNRSLKNHETFSSYISKLFMKVKF